MTCTAIGAAAPTTAWTAAHPAPERAPPSSQSAALRNCEPWRLSRVQSSFGGTTEIMKEIIGRGLGPTVRLWDPITGLPAAILEGHTGRVSSVAFSPDGRLLASAGFDPTVRLWDPATGQPTATLQGHTGWVRSVAFSPDARLLASAGSDQTVRLWDPCSPALISQLNVGFVVTALACGPRGIVVAGHGTLLHLAIVDRANNLRDS